MEGGKRCFLGNRGNLGTPSRSSFVLAHDLSCFTVVVFKDAMM